MEKSFWKRAFSPPLILLVFAGVLLLGAFDLRLNLDNAEISDQEWRADRVDVLIDETGELTAEDVLSARHGWQERVNPFVPEFSESAYWMRFNLQAISKTNTGKSRQFFVENPVACRSADRANRSHKRPDV